jgi:hypothetical protein
MKAEGVRVRSSAAGLALLALSACGPFPEPEPIPPPAGAGATYTETTVCIVDTSAPRGLRTIRAYRTAGGEYYLRDGATYRPLASGIPRAYAAAAEWFRSGEEIRQYGRRYRKHGPLRAVPEASLTLGAPHQGVPVFLDRRDTERPAVLYIPVRPGCVFQPYAAEEFRSS